MLSEEEVGKWIYLLRELAILEEYRKHFSLRELDLGYLVS